jgi:hypothetical protein
MPDFLSRLVERTFGLAPVAQPVIGSIFAPMPAVKNDHIQDLAHDNEPVNNQDNLHIDSARETGIIPQHDNQPAINRKRQTNKIPDSRPVPVQYVESGSQDKDYAKPSRQMDGLDYQSAFTSVQRPLQKKEPLEQNESNFPEHIKSMSLHEVNEQDNQYPHTPPAKLALDDEPLYQVYPDALGSVKPESRHTENQNDRGTPPAKPVLHDEEQFHDADPEHPENVEPGQKDFTDIRENRNIFMPVPKAGYDIDQPQSPETGSVERAESKPLYPAGIQKNRNTNRSVFTSEPEFPHENLSDGKYPGESFSGQNELFINSADSPVDEPLLGYISDSSLPPERLPSPIIASRQNPKRVNNPNASATLEQMGNMLIDRHAATPRPPPTASTVKVTIGRIEIRAVTPLQAPQPQIPPPRQHPVLSLDDYLKQHNG